MRILPLSAALLLCVFPDLSSAMGQNPADKTLNTPSGTIQIRTKDPSGAALTTEVTLSGPAAGQRRRLRTDAQGGITIDDLQPGRYKLEVSRRGFTTQVTAVQVGAAATISQEIELALTPLATSVTVIPETPIGKSGSSIEQVPVPVQTLGAKDLQDSNALDLADLMNKRLNGVYINENQGNPFQPDVNYRGYTASPLLGTPQGLSVYMDGVRQNQPFGDVVAWDLIPKIAIQSTELIPGSNPVYGLNTLGGAISIQTKSGVTNPGASVQVTGGSFGRRAVEGEYGGSNTRGLDWYAAGNYYREDGWRILSPSEVRQSFAKLGWTRGRTSLALSGAYSINALTGNGTQDFRALYRSYSSVYTVPDTTRSHSPSLTLNGTHEWSERLSFSGNAYYRYVRGNTTNGDVNEDSFDQSLYNLSAADIAALRAAGYSGFPTTGNSTTQPFPFWRCIAQGLEKNEPAEKCTGLITNTGTKQNNYGLSSSMTWRAKRNRITVGAGWDRSSLTYNQASQFGYLNPDGVTITGIDSYADGTTNQDDAPVDTRVQLHGKVQTPSVYATDTFSLGKLTVTASGRYNRTSVDNFDRLPSSAVHGTLTSSSVYRRFNPAAGFTYNVSRLASVYFDYSEASRAPTSIEIGCADPNFPCNLPNALVSDPPLHQVVSRTFEAGVRGSSEGVLRWSAGWFRGQNYNDILFVASEQTGFGYFLNFGKTRRTGAEVNLSAQTQHFGAGGGYTFLNATYQSPQEVDGGSNSSNASNAAGFHGIDDNITISPGNRIPQTPQHVLKVFADYKPTAKILMEANVLAVSSSYARGNENNQHQTDGIYYLGSGTTPGYGVANLGARYQINSHFQLFVQINNLLDHRYYTAGQLGPTPYDNTGRFVGRPFPPVNGNYPIRTTTYLAPGAPLAVFGGLRVKLWKK